MPGCKRHTDVAKRIKGSNRKVIVFAALAGTLTITSALLLALAPAPLTAEATTSLFAVDTPRNLDVIFDTTVPSAPNRWKYIYIHHSATASGNTAALAQSAGLADHFVIGNGDGCVDGELQITQHWAQQESILTPPPGISHMDPACISVCLVGDFDQTRPTPTQLRRLGQLVNALQARLQIPADQVWMILQPRPHRQRRRRGAALSRRRLPCPADALKKRRYRSSAGQQYSFIDARCTD